PRGQPAGGVELRPRAGRAGGQDHRTGRPLGHRQRTAFWSAALRWPGPSSPALSIRARIASSARLIAVWVRTISTLGQAVRLPVSISSSISSCARSDRILVGDQNLGGRMMLISPVYSWLITDRARLAM